MTVIPTNTNACGSIVTHLLGCPNNPEAEFTQMNNADTTATVFTLPQH